MKYWFIWMIAGLVSIIAGVLALLNPFAASLAAVLVAGWSFIIVGALQIAAAFGRADWWPRIWVLVLGVLAGILGVWLISRPVEALIPLTFVVGWLFLAFGLAKIFASWMLRHGRLFWPVLASGGLSALLGILIFTDFPAASVSVLGILLAIELISTGVSTAILSWALRPQRH